MEYVILCTRRKQKQRSGENSKSLANFQLFFGEDCHACDSHIPLILGYSSLITDGENQYKVPNWIAAENPEHIVEQHNLPSFEMGRWALNSDISKFFLMIILVFQNNWFLLCGVINLVSVNHFLAANRRLNETYAQTDMAALSQGEPMVLRDIHFHKIQGIKPFLKIIYQTSTRLIVTNSDSFKGPKKI